MYILLFFVLFFGLIFVGIVLVASNAKFKKVLVDLEADIWPVESFEEADGFYKKNKRIIYINGKKKEGKAEWEKYSDSNIEFDVSIYNNDLEDLQVYLNGFHIGNTKKDVNYLNLKFKTELGDKVPEVNEGDLITIVSNGKDIYKGRFYFDRD